MESKTIKVGNVKEREGQYGPSLQIGVNVGGEWENYFVNDAKLFGYFEKGKTLTIEFEKKGNWSVIKGVSTSEQVQSYADAVTGKAAPYKADNSGRNESIEKQTIAKGWCAIYAGCGTIPTPEELAFNILDTWDRAFAPPKPAAKPDAGGLADHLAEAEKQGFIPDEDIPL